MRTQHKRRRLEVTWLIRHIREIFGYRETLRYTTKLAISSNQGVEAKIGRVHRNRLIWREELLGQ